MYIMLYCRVRIPVVLYAYVRVHNIYVYRSYIMRVVFFSRTEKLLSPSSRPRLRLVVCHPDKAVHLSRVSIHVYYVMMCVQLWEAFGRVLYVVF